MPLLVTLFQHSLTQISFPHPVFADDQLLGLEEVENMLQDEETGDQGVDAVASSWRIRSLAAFFPLVRNSQRPSNCSAVML